MKIKELAEQKIASSIFLIRGQKVMLDADLAVLYGVETKYLKRQVNRNQERFPSDFMFFLTKKEAANLRCQIGTSSWGGSRYRPYAFTEHGILMLSSVLNSPGFDFLLVDGSQGSPNFIFDEIDRYWDSPKAIQVNIVIMRVFARIRQVRLENKDLALRMEKLERHIEKHGKDIRSLFGYVESILAIEEKPKRSIGFHP